MRRALVVALGATARLVKGGVQDMKHIVTSSIMNSDYLKRERFTEALVHEYERILRKVTMKDSSPEVLRKNAEIAETEMTGNRPASLLLIKPEDQIPVSPFSRLQTAGVVFETSYQELRDGECEVSQKLYLFTNAKKPDTPQKSKTIVQEAHLSCDQHLIAQYPRRRINSKRRPTSDSGDQNTFLPSGYLSSFQSTLLTEDNVLGSKAALEMAVSDFFSSLKQDLRRNNAYLMKTNMDIFSQRAGRNGVIDIGEQMMTPPWTRSLPHPSVALQTSYTGASKSHFSENVPPSGCKVEQTLKFYKGDQTWEAATSLVLVSQVMSPCDPSPLLKDMTKLPTGGQQPQAATAGAPLDDSSRIRLSKSATFRQERRGSQHRQLMSGNAFFRLNPSS